MIPPMIKWIQKKLFNTPQEDRCVDAKDEVEALIFMFNSNSNKEFYIIPHWGGGIMLKCRIKGDVDVEIAYTKDYKEMLLTISYFGFKYFEKTWD
jgi:hypothetical protein